MKRLIKTGFAFNCTKKIQCIHRAESTYLCSKFLDEFKMNYYLFLRHYFWRTIRTVRKTNNINLVKFCLLQRQTPAGCLLRDHNRFSFFARFVYIFTNHQSPCCTFTNYTKTDFYFRNDG